ncbi:SusC/RagA family TonB-linked outer membrane protein [Mucilaginibacter auburnensis]|nr:SusC/RagA family TonB-linked outer membrane protein [Mucilaginibacter auburnensis]
MKLTVILVMVLNLSAFANVFSQTKISVDLKDTDLSTLINTIERNTSYRFVFSNRKTPTDKKVTVKADNQDVTAVLGKVLADLNLDFRELDNHLVVIAPAGKLNEYLAEQQQQRFKVTGLVTDERTGETLIGATVAVKGTTTAVAVDVAGKFTIEAPSANSTLVIKFVGYTDLEVPIGGKSILDIKMSKVTQNLEEVVITGFGLTTKKATLAGAVSQLSGEELSQSRATSASGAMVGKVAGVNFRQSTGRPGANPDIRIRNFGGDPLIIIDGTRRNIDAFNALDFNDVESLNVLKDGSAAIYGFAGQDGVIVVVTKKGKRGQKPTFAFDSYYGTQTYANFNKPGDIKSYVKGIVQTETYGDGRQSVPTRTITREIYDKVMSGAPGYEGFDWYNYIYKSAPQYQAKLSVSGGTENTDYYISGTTLTQGVGLRDFGDGFKRQNIQANFNANISKRVKFGMQMNGYWSKQSNTNVEGNDFDWQAEAPYRNLPILPGSGASPYANPESGPYVNGNPLYPRGTSPSNQAYSYGLVSPELSGVESTTRRNVSITGTLEVDILPGLKGRMLANYSFLSNQFDSRRMAPSLYLLNSTGAIVADGSFVQQRNNEHTFTNTDNSSLQFQLEYKKSIGQHNFQVNVNQESTLNYAPSVRVTGIPPANNIPYIPNTGLTYLTSFEDNISNYSPQQGYQIRLNYDFAGKYIVEAFGRYDGSSNYRPERRWGFFPGGAIAYRISQEDFWKNSPVLSIFDDFKIKASYGILGANFGSPQENYLPGYQFNQGSAVLNGSVITGTQVLNPPSLALTWGRTYSSDVGIDMTLLNNRLNIALDYFNRTQTGLPANRGLTLPDLVGFQPGNENINTDKNRGVDGSISWRDRVGEFSYGLNASFSYGRSIVGFRYNRIFPSDYNRFIGSIPGVTGTQYGVDRLNGGPFQYTVIGQFQSWEQIQNYGIDQDGKGNVTQKPGDFIFRDTNGDGVINSLDQTRETYQINGGLPPLNFGFGFNANYKGFDIRADFTGGSLFTFEQTSSGFSSATGAYMREWLPNRNTSQYLFDNSSYYSDIFDRNSPIIVGKYPLLLQTNPAPNTNFNHGGWQTNITYIRVRNLQLGYTIPYSVLKSVGVTNLRVYLAAQNLYTFSNMPGKIDPELVTGAGGGLPSPRVLTAGVQVKF